MIPTYRNSSSSPSFPFELNNGAHHDLTHSHFFHNYQFASSSSHLSCQTFFSSTINQDQTKYYHTDQFYQPQNQPEVDKYGSSSGSHDLEKKQKAVQSGLKLTLWKKGERCENQNEKKTKNEVTTTITPITNKTKSKMKVDDQKKQLSPHLETDHSSSSSFNNIPIRVCSDCNTSKTPLWRSGPKGPKSLCNACGIRQRKARRAMAAAAAAANGTNFTTETPTTVKIKVQQPKQKITKVNTNYVVPFKKRCKFITSHAHVAGSSSSTSNNSSNLPQKKTLGFEDFFVNLSNNLALIHRVFPQDEKEAAILLMALSSGLVHG